ncbi:MAG: Fe-S-binding domain-containing protein, partial [Elusimicrobiota bacterium]
MGILSLITFLPLLGAVVILFLDKEKKAAIRWTATAAAAAPLVLSGWLYTAFDSSLAGVQFLEKLSWIPAFNIHYTLGVD